LPPLLQNQRIKQAKRSFFAMWKFGTEEGLNARFELHLKRLAAQTCSGDEWYGLARQRTIEDKGAWCRERWGKVQCKEDRLRHEFKTIEACREKLVNHRRQANLTLDTKTTEWTTNILNQVKFPANIQKNFSNYCSGPNF
jgi:hypothetical protein